MITKRQISVLAAHPEKAFSRQLRRIFSHQKDFVLMDPIHSYPDLVRAIRVRRPRVLLLDARFVRGDGHQLMTDLRRRFPVTKVILLDKRYRISQEMNAAMIGARGYIGGEVEPAMYRKAVRATEAGEIWMRRKSISRILDGILRSAPPA
jgi:DNA-binding NarL/FixJ family response regulator